MPTRHTLSAKRGLPPLGFALVAGRKGSIRFHKASGRIGVAIQIRPGDSDVLSYHEACNRIGFVTASKLSRLRFDADDLPILARDFSGQERKIAFVTSNIYKCLA